MDYINTIENKGYSTGWHQLLVRAQDGNNVITLFFQFDHDPTLIELQKSVIDWGINTQYDQYKQEVIDIYDNIDLLKNFVRLVKANPTVTLTQYNTWLATKTWYESCVIRYFVFRMAVILSQKYNIVLANLTETQILQKLRDWIVATPIRIIAKIFFGNVYGMD
jgi:hypothetical protein